VKLRILNRWKCERNAPRIARAASLSFALLAGIMLAVAPRGALAQTAVASAAPASGRPRKIPAASVVRLADPSGAVIPGAAVVVLNGEGKVAAKATSDAGGSYSVRGLAPGTYSVWVTAQGFAAYRVPGIAVTAGQVKSLNPRSRFRSSSSRSKSRPRTPPSAPLRRQRQRHHH